MTSARPVAVLGAGGRAGRAVVAEVVRRGSPVVAIVRDPARHPGLGGRGVTVVRGDALDPASVAAAAAGARALVGAVTPFTAPPASLDTFDTGYYVRVAETLGTVARWAGARVVVVGLFATLRTSAAGLVQDDPALFPEALRPFARAHLAGVEHLRRTPDVDWLVLAPPPGLTADVEPTGRYRLGDGVLDPRGWDRPLSYADLATAVAEEIDRPTRHRELLAVYGT